MLVLRHLSADSDLAHVEATCQDEACENAWMFPENHRHVMAVLASVRANPGKEKQMDHMLF